MSTLNGIIVMRMVSRSVADVLGGSTFGLEFGRGNNCMHRRL